MALIGKVVGMTGVASLVLGNGDTRSLKLGDSIQTGDTIQTPPGVEVDLQLANGRVIHINAQQLITFTEDLAAVFVPDGLDNAINLATIDTVIKAIEDGRDINEVLEETAAGEGGQFSAYGFGFPWAFGRKVRLHSSFFDDRPSSVGALQDHNAHSYWTRSFDDHPYHCTQEY